MAAHRAAAMRARIMTVRRGSTCLLIALIPALTACSTRHEFRVAAVGDSTVQPTSSNTTIAGLTAPLIVASGNVLLGRSGQLTSLSGPVATTGVINGTVSAVLLTTNQTLVQLADGASVLLNGTGGALGDLVSIDLAQGQVVGGPNSLIGVNVLTSSPTSGQLATASVGSGGSLLDVQTASGRIGAGATINPPSTTTILPQPTTTTLTQPVTSALPGTLGGTLGRVCC
jgi:hypothetical protein